MIRLVVIHLALVDDGGRGRWYYAATLLLRRRQFKFMCSVMSPEFKQLKTNTTRNNSSPTREPVLLAITPESNPLEACQFNPFTFHPPHDCCARYRRSFGPDMARMGPWLYHMRATRMANVTWARKKETS